MWVGCRLQSTEYCFLTPPNLSISLAMVASVGYTTVFK